MGARGSAPNTAAPLRWGVLSTANIARKAVVPALRASAAARVHAVASRDRARAEAVVAELPGARAYASYEALLDDAEVDVVYIALPNALHAPWVERALSAGKHVLCEKPLAPTASACRELGEAARRHGRVLMEAFMYRFHPRTERVLAAVHGGALGTVRRMRASFSFAVRDPGNIRLDPDLAGGSLMDVGCYAVNVARAVFDREPRRAVALARWSDRGVDLGLEGLLDFGDGAIAQIDCALDLPRREHVEIVGDAGVLSWPTAFLPGTGEVGWAVRRADGVVREERVPGVDQYRVMVEHMADRVVETRASAPTAPVAPRTSASEAARTLAAIEALLASARDGGEVREIG